MLIVANHEGNYTIVSSYILPTILVCADSWALLRAGASRTPLFFCLCTRDRGWQDFSNTALRNLQLWYTYDSDAVCVAHIVTSTHTVAVLSVFVYRISMVNMFCVVRVVKHVHWPNQSRMIVRVMTQPWSSNP
jgi:hypothetical protein